MRPLRWFCSALILFVALLSLGTQAAEAAPPYRIMPLGDSITQGSSELNSYRRALYQILTANEVSFDFVGSLQEHYFGTAPDPDFDLDHEGHWGWRADEILANIPTWAAAAQPDIVLMHLGSNDIFQGQTPASTISELGQIIDAIRVVNPNVVILVAQVIPEDMDWLPPVDGYNALIPGLAADKTSAQSPVVVVDMFTSFDLDTMHYDDIHPNETGETFVANQWYAALLPYLGGTSATATNTPTATATNTSTATATFTPTATSTSTFTATASDTATFTPTATATDTSTATASSTPTATLTATASDTATFTPTATATDTSTATASSTPTATLTATASDTATFTPTATATDTSTATASSTPTATVTATATNTHTPTATSTTVALRPDTIGIFRPSNITFYLRNSNSTGYADSTLIFGAAAFYPIAGDWDGDGIDTPGMYHSGIGQFYLTNSTADAAAVHHAFVLGIAGDQPIVGDWDGDGKDSVGVFRPSNGLIYLKNSLTTGFADFTMVLGVPGDVGIAGDWNGDGKDSPGVYRPSNQVFYLTNSICVCAVYADAQLGLGIAGDKPFVGDWNGDGISGVGVYRQSNGLTYIKNALTTGFADSSFVYGSANDFPLAGYWVRVSSPSGVQSAPTFQP